MYSVKFDEFYGNGRILLHYLTLKASPQRTQRFWGRDEVSRLRFSGVRIGGGGGEPRRTDETEIG